MDVAEVVELSIRPIGVAWKAAGPGAGRSWSGRGAWVTGVEGWAYPFQVLAAVTRKE